VCETGDFLGHDRELALARRPAGDLLAGAYGMSMSSNYNTRPRAAEVMVDGENTHLFMPAKRIEELFAGETLLPG
jgi:diaminopimelate decarboxylase